MNLHVSPTTLVTINGKALVQLNRPFGRQLDTAKAYIKPPHFHRTPAQAMVSVGLRYRVLESPTTFRSLITTWRSGLKGFSLYQTNDRISLLLRAVGVASLLERFNDEAATDLECRGRSHLEAALRLVASSHPFDLILCESVRAAAIIQRAGIKIPLAVVPIGIKDFPVLAGDAQTAEAIARNVRAALVAGLARSHGRVPLTAFGPDSLALVPDAALDLTALRPYIVTVETTHPRPAWWIVTEQNPWAAGRLAQALRNHVPGWDDILPTSLFLIRRRVVFGTPVRAAA